MRHSPKPIAGARTLPGVTSAEPAVSIEPGTRLLVAGDGGFAWSCGFIQPYDAAGARQWSEAFDSVTATHLRTTMQLLTAKRMHP